jgi:hypothetical protein
MARRRLLTGEQWAELLSPPARERDIVRHYTLTGQDLATIAAKRGDHKRPQPHRLRVDPLLSALSRTRIRAWQDAAATTAPVHWLLLIFLAERGVVGSMRTRRLPLWNAAEPSRKQLASQRT